MNRNHWETEGSYKQVGKKYDFKPMSEAIKDANKNKKYNFTPIYSLKKR